MSRDIEKIKADIKNWEEALQCAEGAFWNCAYQKVAALQSELRAALTAGIPLDELEALMVAWKDGRAVVLPCKVGDKIYHISGVDNACDADIEDREIYSINICTDGRVSLTDSPYDGHICYTDQLNKISGLPFWDGYYLTRAEAEIQKEGV